jgi:hypothetical protein
MSDVFRYFFEPRSVAVVGASKTPGKAGNEILVNILANGYQGKIFPINPGGEEILGISYRSVVKVGRSTWPVSSLPAEKTLEPLRCQEKGPAVVTPRGYAGVDNRGRPA